MKKLQALSHFWHKIHQQLSCCCHRKSSAKTGSLVTYNSSTKIDSLVTCRIRQQKLIRWFHRIRQRNWFTGYIEFGGKTNSLGTYKIQQRNRFAGDLHYVNENWFVSYIQNLAAKLIRWWPIKFGSETDSLVTYNSSAKTDSLVTYRIRQQNWFASDIQNSAEKLIRWWYIIRQRKLIRYSLHNLATKANSAVKANSL